MSDNKSSPQEGICPRHQRIPAATSHSCSQAQSTLQHMSEAVLPAGEFQAVRQNVAE